jgi:hypothetical protein
MTHVIVTRIAILMAAGICACCVLFALATAR